MEPYVFSLKNNARILRSSMTEAEQKLWKRLRRKQLLNLPFYRQKPILTYIVDFYCPQAKLVIELDGGQHYQPDHQRADQVRDKYLSDLGLKVLRFDNREVLLNIDNVIEQIYQIASLRIAT